MVKKGKVKKFVENPDRKSTRQSSKRVKEVASQEPKPLQAESSLKEAGEKMRSLDTNRLPVASGDHLVGAVEGKYPERKAAAFGHDPETALVRGIMVKKAYYCHTKMALDTKLKQPALFTARRRTRTTCSIRDGRSSPLRVQKDSHSGLPEGRCDKPS